MAGFLHSRPQIVVLTVLTIFIIFSLTSTSSLQTSSLATVLMDRQAGPPLTVSLNVVHQTLHDEPCVVHVIVKNTNPDKDSGTLTVLNWNSPLDPKASLLGVFEVSDADTGKVINAPTLMINRKRPPPPDDLIELAAQQETTTQVTLTGVEFSAGQTYSIRAVGRWMAVWNAPKEDILADPKRLEELSGAMTGSFESEPVTVKQVCSYLSLASRPFQSSHAKVIYFRRIELIMLDFVPILTFLGFLASTGRESIYYGSAER